MERIVLVLAAQHLYGALQFSFSAYERIVILHRVVQAYHIFTPLGSGLA